MLVAHFPSCYVVPRSDAVSRVFCVLVRSFVRSSSVRSFVRLSDRSVRLFVGRFSEFLNFQLLPSFMKTLGDYDIAAMSIPS